MRRSLFCPMCEAVTMCEDLKLQSIDEGELDLGNPTVREVVCITCSITFETFEIDEFTWTELLQDREKVKRIKRLMENNASFERLLKTVKDDYWLIDDSWLKEDSPMSLEEE